ncbi:efflux ABC transporter, permease protein [Aedoeadaptatus coxii]|nr:efflux ABC transporter, permease protein [Peptoniphilus coxii]
MKNPIHRRIPRLFLKKPGVYLPLFFISLLTVTFASSFFISQNSIKPLYYKGLRENKVEDGQFLMANPLTNERSDAIKKRDVDLVENFYKDSKCRVPGDDDRREKILRVFANREKINTAAIHAGRLPKAKGEIAVAANFAKAENLVPGDKLTLDGEDYKITALVATPDYSTILKTQGDLAMDTKHFSVAFVTKDVFDSLKEKNHYLYSYRNHERLSEEKARDRFEDILSDAEKSGPILGATTFYDNRCIQYFIDDMGGDVPMMTITLVILFISLGFISALQTRGLLREEAPVIGTLLSMGYGAKTLIRHYSLVPTCLVILSGIFGNILAYTKGYTLYADLYYTSYNLPPFVPILSLKAFAITTIIPLGIVWLVNRLLLLRYFRLSPLRFLRREFYRKKRKNAPTFDGFPFKRAARLRILSENRLNVLALFFGMFVGNLLLLFSVALGPMFDDYADSVKKDMKYNYTYLVKAADPDVHGVKGLSLTMDYKKGEEKTQLNVLGPDQHTAFDGDLPSSMKPHDVVISTGLAHRDNLDIGDAIEVKLPGSKHYKTLHVAAIAHDIHSIQALMPMDNLNRLIDKDPGNFNLYWSDTPLKINDDLLITTIDRDKTGAYLEAFLENFDGALRTTCILAIVFYFTLVYTVSKLILEKSQKDICYLKIFGYGDGEVASIYLLGMTIAVALFYPLSLPIFDRLVRYLFALSISKLSVYMEPHFAMTSYLYIYALDLAVFVAAQWLGRRKIKALNMVEELKKVSG